MVRNSLKELYPTLAAEYHPTKNVIANPDGIRGEDIKNKYWWKCSKCGYEWEAFLYNRIRRMKGKNCPCCSGKVAVKGINDLETKYPLIANDWNYSKNSPLIPSQVVPNSNKKVWWQCSKGHEWETAPSKRVAGTGCPYCAGKKVLKGYNDLATTNPSLAAEWHPTKNDDLKPTDVTQGSGKKVWWKCSNCGNEFEAIIMNRNSGHGCSICGIKKISISNRMAVEQYSLGGKFIKEYESITVAANELGVSRNIICSACKGKAKTAAGYLWKVKT